MRTDDFKTSQWQCLAMMDCIMASNAADLDKTISCVHVRPYDALLFWNVLGYTEGLAMSLVTFKFIHLTDHAAPHLPISPCLPVVPPHIVQLSPDFTALRLTCVPSLFPFACHISPSFPHLPCPIYMHFSFFLFFHTHHPPSLRPVPPTFPICHHFAAC